MLHGDAGNDTLMGGDGSNILFGGTGNDYLEGGSGSDTLYGEDDNDVLKAGQGDILFGGAGNDQYVLNETGNITVSEADGGGSDEVVVEYSSIQLTSTRFTISGNDLLVSVFDASGASFSVVDIQAFLTNPVEYLTVSTGRGSPNLRYNLNTAYQLAVAGDSIASSAIIASLSDWPWQFGSDGNDTINGLDSANDYLRGYGGNDVLNGLAGNDWLFGMNGNDTLEGGIGNDTMSGGSGNDVINISGSSGFDIVDGGAGSDTLNLDWSANNSNGYGYLTFSVQKADLSWVNFGGWADNATSATIDNLLGAFAASPVQYKYSNYDEASAITWKNLETINVTGYSYSAFSHSYPAFFVYQSGSQYKGGASNDSDTFFGDFSSWEEKVEWTNGKNSTTSGLSDEVVNTLGATHQVKVSGMETLLLLTGSANDTITQNVTNTNDEFRTNAGNDAINAGDGNDSIDAGSGDDTLIGGAGTDTLIGGLGNDIFVIDTTTDVVTENTNEGTDTVQSSISYTITTNIENLTLTGTTAINGTGNAFNNILTGNTSANALNGGSGADSLIGGLGNDIYVVDNTGDVVTETSALATEIDSVNSSVTYTLGANLEKLTLTGTAALNGTGNALNNALTGNAAANLLDGGTGVDSLIGGLGNDVYIVDNTGDVVTEASTLATEIDSVNSSATYTLSANLENLTLTETAAINGTGNTLNNILTGNIGANTLNGGAGADSLIGGLGNDVYVVDNVGDVVTENTNEGTDTVQSSLTYTLSANLENLTLTGTTAINGTGNAFNNILTGNTAANTLNGSTGADSLIGGSGNDVYIIDNTGDIVTETSTLKTEIDSVNSSVSYTLGANLEKLTLTGTAVINGTGNALNNTLTGNAAANTLNGGTGADKMTGGLGNDIYVVDNKGDKATETSTLTSEIDSVNSSVNYTLDANIENLTLTGTAALNGTGNGLANTLTGNTAKNLLLGDAGNDTLSGGADNDTLDGGTGNDVLTGGSGLDVFRFTSTPTANSDTLTDFSVADDTIQLENAVFSKLTTPGVLAATSFVKGAAALDPNDYVVYNATTGALSYDADGNGVGAAVQIAVLGVNLALTNADFIII